MRDQKGHTKIIYLGRRLKKMLGQLPMDTQGGRNENQILAFKIHELSTHYCEKMRVTVFNELTEGMLTQSQSDVMKVVKIIFGLITDYEDDLKVKE